MVRSNRKKLMFTHISMHHDDQQVIFINSFKISIWKKTIWHTNRAWTVCWCPIITPAYIHVVWLYPSSYRPGCRNVPSLQWDQGSTICKLKAGRQPLLFLTLLDLFLFRPPQSYCCSHAKHITQHPPVPTAQQSFRDLTLPMMICEHNA